MQVDGTAGSRWRSHGSRFLEAPSPSYAARLLRARPTQHRAQRERRILNHNRSPATAIKPELSAPAQPGTRLVSILRSRRTAQNSSRVRSGHSVEKTTSAAALTNKFRQFKRDRFAAADVRRAAKNRPACHRWSRRNLMVSSLIWRRQLSREVDDPSQLNQMVRFLLNQMVNSSAYLNTRQADSGDQLPCSP